MGEASWIQIRIFLNLMLTLTLQSSAHFLHFFLTASSSSSSSSALVLSRGEQSERATEKHDAVSNSSMPFIDFIIFFSGCSLKLKFRFFFFGL